MITSLLFLGSFFLSWLRRRGGGTARDVQVPDDPTQPYTIYAPEFDLVLSAADIPAALASASPDLSKGWLEWGDSGWIAARARAEKFRTASEARMAELREDVLRSLAGNPGGEIVVTLLIDLSGSMKGERIAAAAATARWLSDVLADAGARSEVLGFSTGGWHGGFARRKWLSSNRPARPGRLCSLLHVVFKAADEERLSDAAFRAMLHPDLLRENVDGEAIAWASDRLDESAEPRKFLIVVSDGAPVDYVTLSYNGMGFLARHLTATVRQVQDASRISLGAVGLEWPPNEAFRFSAVAAEPTAIPEATATLLVQMIEGGRTP